MRLRNFFMARPKNDNVCDRLEHFKNAIHRVHLSVFGGKTNKIARSAYKTCLSTVKALLETTLVCDQL